MHGITGANTSSTVNLAHGSMDVQARATLVNTDSMDSMDRTLVNTDSMDRTLVNTVDNTAANTGKPDSPTITLPLFFSISSS